MMNAKFSTMMTSAVVLGSLMVGCSTSGHDRPTLALDNPDGYAPHIEKLLANEDAAGALAAAEQLVAMQPDNGDARALLGRAYLANGRYLSARTAFNDAIELGNRAPRTIVSLSMSEAGLGNLDAARALLADHAGALPAADYGLAMTMAGNPREGVRALLAASQAPDATAKTRQNLAYSLAMAGAWAQARLIAGQDLAAKDAEMRVGEWARSLTQDSPTERVVAMLGVSPLADDAGVPVQLALHAASAPVQLASAAPSPAVEPVEIAASQAAPERGKPAFSQEALIAALSVPISVPHVAPPENPFTLASADEAGLAPLPTPEPAIHFGTEPEKESLTVAFTPASAPAARAEPSRTAMEKAFGKAPRAAAAPAARTVPGIAAPASDAKASDWVVQLGAYDSEAVARDKWKRIAAKAAPLKDYASIHSQYALDGRTFYRLAVRGFADRDAATSACAVLKSVGQSCFVRLDDTNTTKQARLEATGKGVQASAQGAGRVRASR